MVRKASNAGSKTEDQDNFRVCGDVVGRQLLPILELLPKEHEALLENRKAMLTLEQLLDFKDRPRELHKELVYPSAYHSYEDPCRPNNMRLRGMYIEAPFQDSHGSQSSTNFPQSAAPSVSFFTD